MLKSILYIDLNREINQCLFFEILVTTYIETQIETIR